MTNLLEIAKRIKAITGLKRDKQIAGLIGITASDYSRRKNQKSDTLMKFFVDWGEKNNINLNWLILGYGTPYLEDTKNEQNNQDAMLQATVNFINKAIMSDKFEVKLELKRKIWEDEDSEKTE